jgi:hypothetical protein
MSRLITLAEISTLFSFLFKFYDFNVTGEEKINELRNKTLIFIILHVFQRPPSSSLSYGGAMNDDVRSPGSGSTPGPLSAQPPPGLGDPDPGKFNIFFIF